MNKRIRLSVCTLAGMAMTLQMGLAGCGSAQATPAATTAATTAASVSPTKEAVALTWYMPKPIDNESNQEAVEAEANKTIKEKINATLKFNLIDSASWEDKMKIMSAAGEAFDLCFTSNWSNRLDVAVQRGALKPVNELLEQYGPTLKKKVDSRAWKSVTYSGKIMAIPSQSPFSQPTAFVFKKELLTKYNFDYKTVKSLAALEPYLEIIKKNEPGVTPILATAKIAPPGARNFDDINLSKGVSYNAKTGKVMLALEIPETVAVHKIVNDFYKKGYIAKDASTKTDFMAEAKSGKYAVLKDSGGYSEDGSKSTSSYGYPTAEALFGYPRIGTENMIGACSAISNTSKNPERAMMLLDLIWSDRKLSNTLAFGLEDKDYSVVSGKGTDKVVIQTKTGAEQKWAIWNNWLGPLWDQWGTTGQGYEALELMQKNNQTAQTADTLGFLFDATSVKTEVAQISAAYAEIDPVLNTGVMPDFDKFIADSIVKLKKAGIEKVQAEVQKQFDDWKTKNK